MSTHHATPSSRFSDRMGITSRPPIQIEAISGSLKTSLWNVVLRDLFPNDGYQNFQSIVAAIAYDFLKWPVDGIGVAFDARNQLRNWFFSSERKWYDVYNFIDYLVSAGFVSLAQYHSLTYGTLVDELNNAFREENAGYRIIEDCIAPITNEIEIAEIQQAVALTDKYAGARTHISTAIDLLSKKPIPDWRNSIKESISAVEAVAKISTENEAATLGDALSILDKRIPIHGSLRQGFIKLYGYTSDADGIRHALLDEPTVGFDEAKFMLVVCSAFVNYLVSKVR